MDRRGKVKTDPVVEDRSLQSSISRGDFTPRQQSALEKDLPLVEAALVADRIVVSRDEEARQLFAALSADHRALRPVLWLRPDESPTEALEWLRRGAKAVKKWQLGTATTAR